MRFTFVYVVPAVFALVGAVVAGLAILDEVRGPANWRRRVGAAAAVALAALGFYLATATLAASPIVLVVTRRIAARARVNT